MQAGNQERYRTLILERIAELEKALKNPDTAGRAAVSPDVAIGRLSRLDAMQMQQVALAAKRRQEEELRELRMALVRIHLGNFGICQRCGQPIPEERLTCQLTAQHCVRCV